MSAVHGWHPDPGGIHLDPEELVPLLFTTDVAPSPTTSATVPDAVPGRTDALWRLMMHT